MSKRALSIVSSVLIVVGVWPMASHADIKEGLVGYWPLDGDATDASRNGNHGTLVGGVKPAPDRYGVPSAALRFPGEADSYVDLGDPAELQITGAMTLTTWIFLNGANQNDGRIVTKCGGAGNEGWDLSIEAGPDGHTYTVAFRVTGTSLDCVRVDDTKPLPMNQWVHVVGIYRPGETVEIYIDGLLRAETTVGVPDSQLSENGLAVLIGSSHDDPDGGWDGLIDEVRIYDRAITQIDIWRIMRANVGCSSAPQPANGATGVPPDVTLSWTAGLFAQTHDVYFGTVAAEVNDASRTDPRGVLLSQGRSRTTYAPSSDLDFGQTYYWRVDEVNAFDSAIYKGNVWTFTVEPYATSVAKVVATTNAISNAGQGPANTVNGSGLNDDNEHSTAAADMWLAAPNGNDPIWIQYRFDMAHKLHEMLVWNYNEASGPGVGSGLKNVTVEYSMDGTAWSPLRNVELAQATATPDYTANTIVSLGAVVARYIRLIVHSNWGTPDQYGLSEIRFSYIPMRARHPKPADGASDIDVDLILSWSAGRDTAMHDVHFSNSAPMVATGAALVGSVATNQYALRPLDFGTTYYWQIDQRNEAKSPSVWQGEIWSFTTGEYAVFDDFESYTDDGGRRIYEIWKDGYDNNTGALVGYMEAPFAEKIIVHGGGQSMPFSYDNTQTPFYSETVRPLVIEQNWLEYGADTLRLFVRGMAGNDPGPLYVAIEDTIERVAVVTHPDPGVLTSATWQEWVIPYSAFNGVGLAGVQKIYLGVGDRDNPVPGGSGLIYIDDIEFGHPIGGPPAPRR